ncbi:MAG: S8 family peptidase [bacterium]
MRRVFASVVLICTFVLAAGGIGAGAPSVPPRVGEQFVETEVLVKLRGTADLESVARSVGARVEDQIPELDVFVLSVPAGSVRGTVLALTNNFLVEYAEPNFIARIQRNPNDPYDDTICYNSDSAGCVKQWAWQVVKAYDAWNVTTGGQIKIAVVDTGIAKSHEDLPAVLAQKNFVNSKRKKNADDNNGHGTHVAGTIGALTNNGKGGAGANWSVRLMAAKVLDANGSGSYAAVAKGIIWAADNGAKVIDLSLGGSSASSTLENAVNYAWNRGAVLACAAGNSGTTAKSYPGAYTNCIAVAATTQTDARASFSTYDAAWVDVAAPGVTILSTIPATSGWSWWAEADAYDAWSGTSMATPHVAGLAGLIWASGRCSTAQCVRDRIERRADAITGTGTQWKWGRVNYFKSVSP